MAAALAQSRRAANPVINSLYISNKNHTMPAAKVCLPLRLPRCRLLLAAGRVVWLLLLLLYITAGRHGRQAAGICQEPARRYRRHAAGGAPYMRPLAYYGVKNTRAPRLLSSSRRRHGILRRSACQALAAMLPRTAVSAAVRISTTTTALQRRNHLQHMRQNISMPAVVHAMKQNIITNTVSVMSRRYNCNVTATASQYKGVIHICL